MRTGSLQLPGAVAALALGLLLNGGLRAEDLLAEAKAKQAVEAQRVERVVNDARNEAYRLAKASRPTDAVELLRGAVATLETDTALKAEKRGELLRRVKNDLKFLESEVRDRRAGIPNDTPRTRRTEDDRRQAEAEVIRRNQADIRSLQNSGRYDEARRMHDDLARRFPGNPSVQAGSTIGGTGSQVAQQKELAKQRNEGMLLVYNSIDKSREMPIGDVQFPRDWAEKTARRTKKTNITEKEKEILKALNTVIPVDFDMTRLQDVIDYIEKKTGQSLIIDKQALAEANVTYESTVTMKAKTTTRTVLRRVLADLDLAYIVKDEAIQVTSIQKAKETLSARTYYVGDLANVGDMRFGPAMARAQMAQQIQQLAVLITQVIEPETWAINGKGGLGTVAFDPITMSFVIRQTAEIHYLLGIGMR